MEPDTFKLMSTYTCRNCLQHIRVQGVLELQVLQHSFGLRLHGVHLLITCQRCSLHWIPGASLRSTRLESAHAHVHHPKAQQIINRLYRPQETLIQPFGLPWPAHMQYKNLQSEATGTPTFGNSLNCPLICEGAETACERVPGALHMRCTTLQHVCCLSLARGRHRHILAWRKRDTNMHINRHNPR